MENHYSSTTVEKWLVNHPKKNISRGSKALFFFDYEENVYLQLAIDCVSWIMYFGLWSGLHIEDYVAG